MNYLTKLHRLMIFVSVVFIGTSMAFAKKPEKLIEKTFDVSPGGQLTLETDLGSIEIETHSSKRVDAQILIQSKTNSEDKFQQALKDFEITFSKKNSEVFIQGEKEKNDWFKKNKLNVHFKITVPEKFDVDLKTSGGSISVDDLAGRVEAATSGGSLTFGSIQGTIQGKTSGGRIRVQSCAGQVNVKTSGGGIDIGSVKGDIKAYTSGGPIQVDSVNGNVEAKTSGGGIRICLADPPTDDCLFSTSGGSIHLILNPDSKCSIDASTSGGSVSTDFPILVQGKWGNHSLKGDVNGGGPLIQCKTSGGSIKIVKK